MEMDSPLKRRIAKAIKSNQKIRDATLPDKPKDADLSKRWGRSPEVIGGRSYQTIMQKSNQVKCNECVFRYRSDEPHRMATGVTWSCSHWDIPLGNDEYVEGHSCPKGKVPL